ncbi:MAG: hypothetical protein Q4G33_14880 [bacterium]|nr:hypothetical protein [bacterium]
MLNNCRTMKICIIGRHESLKAVRNKGFNCIDAANADEAGRTLRDVSCKDYNSIYVAEEFYDTIYSAVSEYCMEVRHRIKLFPSYKSGDLGIIRELMIL